MNNPKIMICSSGAPVIRNEIELSEIISSDLFWDPFDLPLVLRGLRRLHFSSLAPFKDKWLPSFNSINSVENIIIFDGLLSELTLPHIRKITDAKITYYFWNPIKKKCPLNKISNLADSVVTFDPDDAKKFGLNYFDAFSASISFVNSKNRQKLNPVYDLSFVGKSKGRLDKINEISRICNRIDINFFLYVLGSLNESRQFSFVKTKPLAHSDYEQIFLTSRAILDLTAPGQRGITVRGLQALAQGVKVITDNPNLLSLIDEQTSKNVMIVEDFFESSSQERKDFLKSEYVGSGDLIKSKFGFDNWLLNLIKI